MRCALCLLMLDGGAEAQDWRAMGGEEIRAVLAGTRLVYKDGITQEFRASGQTIYNAGRESVGRWTVRGDRYCSQWPPADGWICCDMARQGAALRFVGDRGESTIGQPE